MKKREKSETITALHYKPLYIIKHSEKLGIMAGVQYLK
jgi:hypothetical protein